MPVARAAPSGTRLITSTPPATTTSCCPDITACTAKSSACWLDPHARLTVVPGMDSGHPAARTEYRPMLLDWSPTCDTQPQTTSSTIPGSTPARSTSAVSTSGGQVGGVHVGQPAVALADRRADRFDDYRFTHLSSPFLTGDRPGRWPPARAARRCRPGRTRVRPGRRRCARPARVPPPSADRIR